MPIFFRRLLLAAALTSAGCAAGPSPTAPADDLARLTSVMTGTFDSRAQAEADEAFFNIRLVMLPIWEDRADGPWLYVEQAVAASADRPYRQRVYRLESAADGVLLSHVYTLPGDPLAYAGAWEGRAMEGLTPADLVLREGCSIRLSAEPDGTFVGGTVGTGCASDLRGATYATSEVRITPERLVSWDRGWDHAGEQVWGAVTGGYVFVKRSSGAPIE